MRAVFLIALFLGGLGPATARAADPDTEIARRHFHRGRALYQAKDYRAALAEFEAGRKVLPLPELDFNIGHCYDLLEQPAEAIQSYEAYLARQPSAVDAADVRERIGNLKTRLPKPVVPPTAPAPAPAPHPARPSLVPPLLVGALALVAAGVGVGLVVSVAPEYRALDEAWAVARTEALQEQARGLELRANVGYALLGVAGAAAVIDVILWGLASRSGGDRRAWIAPSPGGIVAGGVF